MAIKTAGCCLHVQLHKLLLVSRTGPDTTPLSSTLYHNCHQCRPCGSKQQNDGTNGPLAHKQVSRDMKGRMTVVVTSDNGTKTFPCSEHKRNTKQGETSRKNLEKKKKKKRKSFGIFWGTERLAKRDLVSWRAISCHFKAFRRWFFQDTLSKALKWL